MPQKQRMLFPVLRNNPELVYLDYAATTFCPDEVIASYVEYNSTIGVSRNRGVGPLASKAEIVYSESSDRIKNFWNSADNYDILYTKNATEALNLLSVSFENHVKYGDIIVLSEYEHHSNILPWKRVAERKGANIVLLPLLESGKLDYSLLDGLPKDRIKIISLSCQSNITGYCVDVEKIQKFRKGLNIYLFLDVSQMVGHRHVDFSKIDADAYCMSAHKMYGPKNLGACFIRKDLIPLMQPFMLGGGMVWNSIGNPLKWQEGKMKFEAGTLDIGGVKAWATTCDFLEGFGFEKISIHENDLISYLKKKMNANQNIHLLANKINYTPIVSFWNERCHSHDVAEFLKKENVEIRVGHMCSQNTLNAFNLHSVCRCSVGLGCDFEDVDFFCSCMEKLNERE